MRAPVIFIGMHRSGTSMIGRLLEDLGMFFGAHKDENNEALFFQDLNEWLLIQCGGRWDNPVPFNQYFWRNEELVKWTEIYLRNLLSSPRFIQFLGARRFLSGGIHSPNQPWGWKDPRTTFTLPMWLRIFPDAKIISIERNGVDVAQSLLAREIKVLSGAPRFYKRYRALFFLHYRRGGFAHSPRCLDLDDAFTLWEEYTSQAATLIAELPRDRVLALRYEDVLHDPVKWLSESASFCQLQASSTEIKEAVKGIRVDRAKAYESNVELRRFAATRSEALNARGYTVPGISE